MSPAHRRASFAAAALALIVWAHPGAAQSLRGSSASLDIQNRIAREHDFTYIESPAQVRRFASAGYLVPVRANQDFDLHAVSFPYARPEAELFIRRLARQYRAACGEKLVVTSLTRPQTRQPHNASDRSVHPTGMAIDLRRSNTRACRAWLEDVLLSLESMRVLEATRESRPPHYHIALFPRQYDRYVARLAEGSDEPGATPSRAMRGVQTASARSVAAESRAGTSRSGAGRAGAGAGQPSAADGVGGEYRVRRGDSLWTIARRVGSSVEELRVANDLASSRIYVGQMLRVPGRSP